MRKLTVGYGKNFIFTFILQLRGMKKLYFILLGGLIMLSTDVIGQDIHFSQFYMSPLTLNPAMTGVMNCNTRFIGNYRNQWSPVIPGNAKFALANLKISQWRPTKPTPPSPPPAWKTDFTKGSLSGWTDAWLPGATFSGEGIIFTSEFSAGKTLWSLRQIPLFNVELAFRIRGQEPLILLDSDEGIGYAVILDRFVNFACGTPRASLPYMHLAKHIKWDPKAWYHVVLRFKGDKLTVLRDGKLIAEGQIPAELLCNGRVGIGCRGRREMTLKDFGMRPLSKTAPPPVKTPTSAAVVKKPPIKKPTIKDPVKMIKPPTRKSIVITRLNSLNRNIVAEITYGVHAQGTVASVRLFGPGSTKPLQRMQIIVSTAGKKTCTFRDPMMGWKPGPYTCDVTIDEKPVTSKTILYGK